jgi:hypothetical protein
MLPAAMLLACCYFVDLNLCSLAVSSTQVTLKSQQTAMSCVLTPAPAPYGHMWQHSQVSFLDVLHT